MSFYSSLYRASSRQKTMVVPRLSSSPTLVSELMSFFFHEREPTKSQNHVESIDSLQDLVHRLPGALRKRKRGNIDPGAPDDPISLLFRYVPTNQPQPTKRQRGFLRCVQQKKKTHAARPLVPFPNTDKLLFLQRNGASTHSSMILDPTPVT